MNTFSNIEALVVAIASAIYNAGYKQQKQVNMIGSNKIDKSFHSEPYFLTILSSLDRSG